METSTPPSPPIASPKAVATAAAIMSFFKKLANEFEKLDFGSDDKGKRKNESQSQGPRGKKCPHPHPRCASRSFKRAVGVTPCRFPSPSCPSSLQTAAIANDEIAPTSAFVALLFYGLSLLRPSC